MKHSFLYAALVCAALFFQAVPARAQESLELSLRDAVLSALEGNPSLRAQRYAAAASSTYESEAFAEFVPTFEAGAQASRLTQNADTYETAEASAGISETLPTGTALSAAATAGRNRAGASANSDPRVGLDLRLTQSLLKGGLNVNANLARVRMARLDVFSSRYELKGYTETLVYNVENAYWTYYLAQRQLEIYRESLRLSEENLANTRQRISVGSLPEIELAAAQAEVAQRNEALITAEGDAETARLRLVQMVNPGRKNGNTAAGPGPANFWDMPVILKDSPSQPDFSLDTVASHVELGLKLRPDLAQARIALERGELEVARTANGALPKLDVFIALGATGYADSFGGAAGKLFDEGTRLTGGVNFTWPLGSVAERAQAKRAVFSRMQQEEAVRNMELTVELDIRTAYVTVQKTRSRIAASAETARLQQENLRAETQKYNVGRSTSFAVAQAERNLLEARLAEAQSVVDYLAAILALYKQEGTLLERRGVETAEAAAE
ncbi:MAG: TolC family protein [Spirochaetales bacterium]|jgi:outer membrane protein TolC|nr:TolC family protein [Spirochaetales bacterium]